jgi:hypothetical protein
MDKIAGEMLHPFPQVQGEMEKIEKQVKIIF